MKVYIIGALKNPNIPQFANELKERGFEPFADWHGAGPDADDCLRRYGRERGWSYSEVLQSHAAKNIFAFDKRHIDAADATVMLAPCGKSAHLELGYVIGKGKPGFILFDDEPERLDIMLQFATGIFFDRESLFAELKQVRDCAATRYAVPCGVLTKLR